MPRRIVFEEIEGIQEGHWFEGRRDMMENSFHRNWAAGIDGNGNLKESSANTTENSSLSFNNLNSFSSYNNTVCVSVR